MARTRLRLVSFLLRNFRLFLLNYRHYQQNLNYKNYLKHLRLLFRPNGLLLRLTLVAIANLRQNRRLTRQLIRHDLKFLLTNRINFNTRLLNLGILMSLARRNIFLAKHHRNNFLLLSLVTMATKMITIRFNRRTTITVNHVTFTQLNHTATRTRSNNRGHRLF